MGDKTQIAAMTMAGEKKRPREGFIAASLALTLVSAIGVVVRSMLSEYQPLDWDQARGWPGIHILRSAGADWEVLSIFHLSFDIYHWPWGFVILRVNSWIVPRAEKGKTIHENTQTDPKHKRRMTSLR
jgi:hypothetical protein